MSNFVEYRLITGYAKYQAGSDGSVRKKITDLAWQHLKVIVTSHGYGVVSLTDDCGVKKQHYVSALVLTAFVGPRPKGMQACHANGIRIDNRLDNLRWDTPAGNEADKEMHGTKLKGSKNRQHRLTEQQVVTIKRMLAAGVPKKQLGRQFGVSDTAITYIATGRNWGWLV